MRRTTLRSLALVATVMLIQTSASLADSVFDSRGMGEDVIPALGATRALGGAVTASLDPFLASIINPCAAARAKALTVTTGLAHTSATSTNVNEEKKTVTFLYPSLALVVPLKRISILTGIFLEKQGRISLTEADTLFPEEEDIAYTASYRRESSIYSVPVFVSTTLKKRLVCSAGVLVSFCDLREEMTLDFLASQYTNTNDVMDTYAVGESFAAAFVLDLTRLRVGGLFRTAADLDGELERSNNSLGLWSTRDISISSHDAFRLGLAADPIQALSVEIDYDRNPWSRLKLKYSPSPPDSSGPSEHILSDQLVERWSVGIQYHGDYLWHASKYPLNFGYYREPLDWQGTYTDPAKAGKIMATGRITEEVFSIGTSIPMANEKAIVGLAFEIGTRKAKDTREVKEKSYTVSVSVAAAEAWRREIKR